MVEKITFEKTYFLPEHFLKIFFIPADRADHERLKNVYFYILSINSIGNKCN